VHEYVDNKLPWDLAFLAFGALQIAAGWAMIRAGKADVAVRGQRVN
jgi:uncharacterized membrane protein